MYCFKCIFTIAVFIVTFGTLSAQSDDTSASSSRPAMKIYWGINATTVANQRTVGLLENNAAQYGNGVMHSLGINAIIIGDLLFRSSRLRSQVSFDKFLNAYPSGQLLENTRFSASYGYNIIESESFYAYPLLGISSSNFYVDTSARILLVSAETGIGADYRIAGTPIMLSVQATYLHSFNIFHAKDARIDQPGFAVKAYISFFIRDKHTYWGWE
jgi:hypothetical protein